jgi:hypothetical protein
MCEILLLSAGTQIAELMYKVKCTERSECIGEDGHTPPNTFTELIYPDRFLL